MYKKVVGIAASLLLLVFGVFLIGEWWVESTIANLINKNPDRAYNINFEDLDLHALLKGATLESATITPLNVTDSTTDIIGTVDRIVLAGVRWRELLFRKSANINEITLVHPKFEVHLVDKEHHKRKHKSTGGFQNLFGDILNRGIIHNFRLEDANIEVKDKSDSLLIAQVYNYSLAANEIVTDSIRIKQMIPFKVGRFHSSMDSGYFQLNDYTGLSIGPIEYSSSPSKLQLNHISLSFTKDRLEVSQLVGKQMDLLEVEIHQLTFKQIGAQTAWHGDLDIRAEVILIDGLVLKDYRDKNKDRPPDVEKPMFNGMVSSIPVPLKIDSIIIKNSDIYYSELGENKLEAGTVHFANLNGSIVNVTNIPELQQQHQSFSAILETELNQAAAMDLKLEVPYHGESFYLDATIGKFDLGILNTTVTPMAGIEISSGIVEAIEIKMNANGTEASNKLRMDYKDLNLAILKDEDHDNHKKGFFSFVANSAIRSHNTPEQNQYHLPEYQSYRNIYRGPFNFMWESVKEGMLLIVPTEATGILLGDIEKKSRKKQKKERNKHKPDS